MCAYFSSSVPQKWNMLVERNIIINTTYCFPKILYIHINNVWYSYFPRTLMSIGS